MKYVSGILTSPALVALCLIGFLAPAAHGGQLEIGPVPGLTTSWHPAPDVTSVPLARGTATLQLRHRMRPGAAIAWHGATEVENDGTWSVAECHLAGEGRHVVTAELTYPTGYRREESCVLDVVRITPDDVRISPVEVSVAPVVLDEDDLNASTYEYFRGESIARLRRVSENHYVTSTHRAVKLRVEVDPPGFAPLIEWRTGGRAAHLGSSWELEHLRPARQVIWIGAADSLQKLTLETYDVEITSHVSNQTLIPTGEPIKFTATTDPPGFEDEIHWLASTKYGACEPTTGQGPEFTVQFEDTWGPHPSTGEPFQWLGLKADGVIFNQDQKLFCPLPAQAGQCGFEPTITCAEECTVNGQKGTKVKVGGVCCPTGQCRGIDDVNVTGPRLGGPATHTEVMLELACDNDQTVFEETVTQTCWALDQIITAEIKCCSEPDTNVGKASTKCND